MICSDKPAQKMLADFSLGRETDTTMARVRSITGRRNASLGDGWRLVRTASAAVAASDTLSGALDWIAALVEDDVIRRVHTTPLGHMAGWQTAVHAVGRRSNIQLFEETGPAHRRRRLAGDAGGRQRLSQGQTGRRARAAIGALDDLEG